MEMNRRNALIGLGAIATGGGAIFGSGAFSQVTADRSVSVETAGDAGAFLELSETDENSGFVDQSGGKIEFSLNENGGASGAGFNYKGVSYIEPLFKIKNGGSGAVGIRIGSTTNTAASITSTTFDGESNTNCFQYENSGDTIEMVFYTPDNDRTVTSDFDFLDDQVETLSDSLDFARL